MAYELSKLTDFLAMPEPMKFPNCPYCNGQRDPTPRHDKPEPWAWWEKLGKPKYAVAPMVDQSELPFRMLCRKYGATLAYTPMFHSFNFCTSAGYRQREFSTVPEDRPLFVQFCGNDADTVLAAARHVEDQCDAVDLNLGCPQGIAKKGYYGSFLMESWDVVHTILHTLAVELKVPVTAKMRVFDDLELTLRYARMLRDTGIHLLAVHGRTREMKGQETGLADLDKIAAVKKMITNIPVLANGNILHFKNVEPNLAATGCDGYLSAEALLWDPRLFANVPDYVLTGRGFVANKAQRLAGVRTAREYLAFVRQYPCPAAWVKSHLFKMLHHSLEVHPTRRVLFGKITNDNSGGEKQAMLDMIAFVEELEEVEKACDIDEYVKQHPRRADEERPADAEEGGGGAAAAAAASSSKAAQQPPPGCRRLAVEADYESQVEGFGSMFE